MKRAILAASLVALAAASGCGGGGEGETLARVNGASMTVAEFYASVPEELLAVMSLDDQREALENWVKTELFYQEGLRRGYDKEESLSRRLREIEREMVAEECIRRLIVEGSEISEEEARGYFEEHRSDYAIQVRLAHILVRSRQEAERAEEQIAAGTPFESVAEAVSIDQTASLGGDLGYMRRGEMVHELEEAAYELKVGEVSDVIASSYGYHIIKVLDRYPGAGQPSFDSKRSAVMNFLTSRARRGAFDDLLAGLEERATVVIDTSRLRLAAQERLRGTGDPGDGDENVSSEGDTTNGEIP